VGFSKIIGGCAAMVKDGYGAFYSIEDNNSQLSQLPMSGTLESWKQLIG